MTPDDDDYDDKYACKQFYATAFVTVSTAFCSCTLCLSVRLRLKASCHSKCRPRSLVVMLPGCGRADDGSNVETSPAVRRACFLRADHKHHGSIHAPLDSPSSRVMPSAQGALTSCLQSTFRCASRTLTGPNRLL